MARAGRSSLEGYKECREALQILSKAVQRGVGTRALASAAEMGAGLVRAAAPVSTDPNNKTPGSLRDSVRVDKREKNQRGRPRVAIRADDVAAVPNEFGTSKMAAQPFFRPTIDANRPAIAAKFGGELKSETDAAVARAAKRAAKAA